MKKFAKRFLKILLVLSLLGFGLLNYVAYQHAYKFTHFSNNTYQTNFNDIKKMNWQERFKILFTGIENPKPLITDTPNIPFTTIRLQSLKSISAWHCTQKNAIGSVILLHGYKGSKSQLIDRANIFYRKKYNVLLIDFMGCGDSEGNETTIGFKEAQDVVTAYRFMEQQHKLPIILLGNSLGAAALLKALHDYKAIKPKAIILEAPFASLKSTIVARCKAMQIPSFLIPDLLLFWGKQQSGIDTYAHKPFEYAKQVHCPVLYFYGAKDVLVANDETQLIYNNLGTTDKKLVVFKEAGHENYLNRYETEYLEALEKFLPMPKK
jgi:uncharacterized protein